MMLRILAGLSLLASASAVLQVPCDQAPFFGDSNSAGVKCFTTPILSHGRSGGAAKFPTDDNGDCKRGLYLSNGDSPTFLHKFSGSSYTNLGGSGCPLGETENTYNSIGYNSATNYIIGVTDGMNENPHHLVEIDVNGCALELADLGPLAHNTESIPGKHIAGDIYNNPVGLQHEREFWSSYGEDFRRIFLLPIAANVYGYIEYKFTTCTSMNDYAFSPISDGDIVYSGLDGNAFGWDLSLNKFCMFNPTGPSPFAQPVETVLNTFGIAPTEVGAIFFDIEANIYMFDNSDDSLRMYSGLDTSVQAFLADDTNNIPLVFVRAADETPNGSDTADNSQNVDGVSCIDTPGGGACELDRCGECLDNAFSDPCTIDPRCRLKV